MKTPDMLRFTGGPVGADDFMVGWDGPWPPPDRMWIARGLQSGIVKVFDRAEIDADWLEQMQAASTILVGEFRLASASVLPDDFESEHVFRGADYVAVEES